MFVTYSFVEICRTVFFKDKSASWSASSSVFCSVPRSNEAGALASFEENRRYYDDDGVDLFTKAFSILFS